MSTQCAVAIVGAGYTAREHARAFSDVPGTVLAGVHSRTRARAEKLATECRIGRICDSVRDLYETTRAQLVVVTVPELEMNRVARACFEFPWAVLLEKPAGYDLADAGEILAAAKASRRNVFVALNRRFYSSTRQALDGLAASPQPRLIKVQDQQDRAEALRLGQPERVVQNWMYANSIHLVDYLRVLGRGSVSRITPLARWNAKEPRLVLGKVEFESGDVGIYEGIWDSPGPWAVSVQTGERRWELRPLERLTVQQRGERKSQDIPIHEWDTRFKPGFRLQAEHAVSAALGKPTECTTLEDAYQTMHLIADLYA